MGSHTPAQAVWRHTVGHAAGGAADRGVGHGAGEDERARRSGRGPLRRGDHRLGHGVGALVVHAAHVRIRGNLDPDPRGDDRGDGVGATGGSVIPLSYYLILSATLFAIGTAGVFMRRNLITILLSIEIILDAVNLSFVAFGRAAG